MAKKINFRNDMKEAKTPEVNAEGTERLPTEKGYTRTKRKLKGTKNNEQTLSRCGVKLLSGENCTALLNILFIGTSHQLFLSYNPNNR